MDEKKNYSPEIWNALDSFRSFQGFEFTISSIFTSLLFISIDHPLADCLDSVHLDVWSRIEGVLNDHFLTD